MSWIDEFVSSLFPLDASMQRIEIAYGLKHQNLPRSIFKYREVNVNSIKNLENDTVWIADPRSFNDPYDCSSFIDFDELSKDLYRNMPDQLRGVLLKTLSHDRIVEIQATLRESADPETLFYDLMLEGQSVEKAAGFKNALKGAVRAMYEDMVARSSDGFKSAFKVCSFSERVDSTLMWAHYANYHKGFCVEYSICNLPHMHHLCRFLYPVIYSDSPFNATENVRRVGKPEFNNLYLNKAGLIKSNDWHYEREWRLIFSNGIIASEQAYPVPRPSTVYLGSHISKDDQAKIEEICKIKGIQVRKMKHASGSFSMEPLTVEEADRKFFRKQPSA